MLGAEGLHLGGGLADVDRLGGAGRLRHPPLPQDFAGELRPAAAATGDPLRKDVLGAAEARLRDQEDRLAHSSSSSEVVAGSSGLGGSSAGGSGAAPPA